MSEIKNNRHRWLHIRLTEDEHNSIYKQFKNTTCRKLSDFARRILFNRKVTVNTRNQSLDDFMAEMMQLRNELNHIGNNFNQSVKKLHTLDNIPEIKMWAMSNESSKKDFMKKVDEIKIHLNKISDKWLQ
jgi:predicted GNAT family acetyltransferase